MKPKQRNPLSAEFLYELYSVAIRIDIICSILVEHMHKEYLPDRSFQKIQEVFANHYRTYKVAPSYTVLTQTFSGDYDVIELINTFREFDGDTSPEIIIDMLESYIKGIKLQIVYSEVGKLYNQNKQNKAEEETDPICRMVVRLYLKNIRFY